MRRGETKETYNEMKEKKTKKNSINQSHRHYGLLKTRVYYLIRLYNLYKNPRTAASCSFDYLHLLVFCVYIIDFHHLIDLIIDLFIDSLIIFIITILHY